MANIYVDYENLLHDTGIGINSCGATNISSDTCITTRINIEGNFFDISVCSNPHTSVDISI